MDIDKKGILRTAYYSECSIADGLIGWWPLNGSAIDLCGDNDGIVSNATVSQGLNQSCYSFNGTSSQILIPGDNFLNFIGNVNYTACAWIYPLGAGSTWHGVFSKGNSQQYALTLNSPSMYLHYETNIGGFSAINTPAGTITTNTWQHVLVRYDGSTKKIFINGIEKASVVGTVSSTTNTEDLRIGQANNGEWFSGKIQDVRIYNRALSPQEIEILYKTTGGSDIKMEVTNGKIYLTGSLREV